MTCRTVRRSLAGYFDGAAPAREHAVIHAHLSECAECAHLLESYRRLSTLLSGTERVAPPSDLAVRIRLEAAKLRERPALWRRAMSKASLVCRNLLQPLAVPATGGVLAAVLAFVVVTQGLVVGSTFGEVPGDRPLNLVQPARMQSMGPFSLSDFARSNDPAGESPIMVEATVDSGGEVLDYQILSGPDSDSVRHQLDQVLMFSRFSPQTYFGRPMSGGRVILSFSEVRVKG